MSRHAGKQIGGYGDDSTASSNRIDKAAEKHQWENQPDTLQIRHAVTSRTNVGSSFACRGKPDCGQDDPLCYYIDLLPCMTAAPCCKRSAGQIARSSAA
jgi:hypothetical protein